MGRGYLSPQLNDDLHQLTCVEILGKILVGSVYIPASTKLITQGGLGYCSTEIKYFENLCWCKPWSPGIKPFRIISKSLVLIGEISKLISRISPMIISRSCVRSLLVSSQLNLLASLWNGLFITWSTWLARCSCATSTQKDKRDSHQSRNEFHYQTLSCRPFLVRLTTYKAHKLMLRPTSHQAWVSLDV